MNKFQPTARILMCAPEHFAVAYRINPWMDPASWERHARAQATAAREQWAALHRTVRELGAEIDPEFATAREVCLRLMEKGVLSKETHHTVIRLAPPLVIARDDLDWALDRFEETLKEIERPRSIAA